MEKTKSRFRETIDATVVEGTFQKDNRDMITKLNALGYGNIMHSTLEYINNTPSKIYISFRDGSVSLLPPVCNPDLPKEFIVVHRKRVSGNPDFKIFVRPINGNDPLTEQLTAIANENQNRCIEWIETIPFKLLKKKTRGVYLARSDVMITLGCNGKTIYDHPFNKEAVMTNYLNHHDRFNPETDFMAAVMYMPENPEIQHQPIYAVWNNIIAEVKPKRPNVKVAPGVKFAGFSKEEEGVDSNMMINFTLEQVLNHQGPVPCFRTHAEAVDWIRKGNNQQAYSLKQYELEIERTKKDIAAQQLELSQLKIDLENAKARRDEAQAILDAKNKEEEARLDKIKRAHEEEMLKLKAEMAREKDKIEREKLAADKEDLERKREQARVEEAFAKEKIKYEQERMKSEERTAKEEREKAKTKSRMQFFTDLAKVVVTAITTAFAVFKIMKTAAAG